MEIIGKKHVDLYLTGWQTRMVMELLGSEAQICLVPSATGPVLRCTGPAVRSAATQAKRMYLTGQQRKEVKRATGLDYGYMEIVAEGVKYLPAPAVRAA